MVKRFISFFLNSPLLFNLMQCLIADQTHVKKFVKKGVAHYKPKALLDIGFGTGNFMDTIPDYTEYLGIDNNPRYVSYVLKKHPSHRFLLQDANDTNFYKGRVFDVLMLISILHHLSDQELAHILPLVKKTTKKAVIISDIIPNPPGFLPKLLIKFDRGRYVRARGEKLRILRKYFKVVKTKDLPQGLGVQTGIVCEVKKY